MHALYVTVTIADGQADAAQKALKEQVVPRVRSAPGFVKGIWTTGADRRSGASIVVFKTEADANNAAQMARSNPTPQGVTLNAIAVCEVAAEA